jgi:hypothetical protein
MNAPAIFGIITLLSGISFLVSCAMWVKEEAKEVNKVEVGQVYYSANPGNSFLGPDDVANPFVQIITVKEITADRIREESVSVHRDGSTVKAERWYWLKDFPNSIQHKLVDPPTK